MFGIAVKIVQQSQAQASRKSTSVTARESSDKHAFRRIIAATAAFLTLTPQIGPADDLQLLCLGENNDSVPSIVNDMPVAKKNLAEGHYKIAMRQSKAIETASQRCIDANLNPTIFSYVHGFALLLQAQALLATGDISGKTLMRRGTDEEQHLADNSDAEPAVRKLARDAAYGGNIEIKRAQAIKPRELITPPPTAPPDDPRSDSNRVVPRVAASPPVPRIQVSPGAQNVSLSTPTSSMPMAIIGRWEGSEFRSAYDGSVTKQSFRATFSPDNQVYLSSGIRSKWSYDGRNILFKQADAYVQPQQSPYWRGEISADNRVLTLYDPSNTTIVMHRSEQPAH